MAEQLKPWRRWKGGSRVEPPLYKLSANDQWCNQTRRRLALKLGELLVQNNVLHRQIGSLQMPEMEAIVECVAAEYTVARSERYDTEEAAETTPALPDRLSDLIGI